MVATIVHVEKEADSTVLTDLEEIELAGCTISSEDESTAIAVENLHLYLNEEVAEVRYIGGAGDKKVCMRSAYMVSLSAKSTPTRGAGPFIPAVALTIIPQGVIEC